MLKRFMKGVSMIGNISTKAKVILAVFILAVLVFAGFLGFQFWDYTQNNPKFCVSCHLMQPAFDAWETSVHTGINCHECHHLSIPEQNQLLVSFIVHRPEEVPERHGKVIVPWKYCIQCHWETKEGFEAAPPIADSPLHAKHYFMEKIECSKCHGYETHEFVPEPRFCTNCHENKDVHGEGMQGLACLNCHTDTERNLLPNRNKCLYCHGSDEKRELLEQIGTPDVRHYKPEAALIESATKIEVPPDAPMQFYCYECHKPHTEGEITPSVDNCLECHSRIPEVGAHDTHIKMMGMSCSDCHKPHVWTVDEEQAKQTCTACHEYRSPQSFIE